MVPIDNYLNGDRANENDMQMLKDHNFMRIITFLVCNASLSAKNFDYW